MRAAVLLVVLAGCGSADVAPQRGWFPAPAQPYATLQEYGFFLGTGATQQVADGVLPYSVISPLYSDDTSKHRYLAIPRGAHITYGADAVWELPVGSFAIKTFAYPRDGRDASMGERLLETRVLQRTAAGWIGNTYVWNDAQTVATRRIGGTSVQVTWIDATGAARANDYTIPNNNQCLLCHGQMGRTNVLGVRTAMLDRNGADGANQLDAMVARGWLAGAIPPYAMRTRFVDPMDATAPLDLRARAYLHSNCGHCHNPADTSTAMPTGLDLDYDDTAPVNLGVCRRPNAAGRGTGGNSFDVVPGHPERSVMVFRMQSADPELRMPVIPNNFVNAAGVALVSQWIAGMTEMSCGGM